MALVREYAVLSIIPCGAEGAEKEARIRNGRKTFMSDMLFSIVSYLVLINLLSKDESILMKKNENFP